jgi:DNA-binding IclR family transcriptional regulator
VAEDATDHRYYFGPLFGQLVTSKVIEHEDLIRCAMDDMQHLARIHKEVIALDILMGICVVSLYEIPSEHSIRLIRSNNKVGPLRIGASAKVLLAQLKDERFVTAMKHLNLKKSTDNSVTDKIVLAAQVKETRQKGFAVSYGEIVPGALCISAPIHNYSSPAALSVVGPEIRLKEKQTLIIRDLKKVSRRISGIVSEIHTTKIRELEELTRYREAQLKRDQ